MRDEVVHTFFRDLRAMIRSKRDVPVLFNDTVLLERQDWRSDITIADGFMFEAAETPEEKLFNLALGKSTGEVIWTYLGHHTEYDREHMSDKSVRGWYSYPVEGQELLLDGAVATAAGVGASTGACNDSSMKLTRRTALRAAGSSRTSSNFKRPTENCSAPSRRGRKLEFLSAARPSTGTRASDLNSELMATITRGLSIY